MIPFGVLFKWKPCRVWRKIPSRSKKKQADEKYKTSLPIYRFYSKLQYMAGTCFIWSDGTAGQIALRKLKAVFRCHDFLEPPSFSVTAHDRIEYPSTSTLSKGDVCNFVST
jgi:hypothetical protein